MVRLVSLSLTDVKNVNHGVVKFNDLPGGGSVTGIYGQNGSGKTSVIDALDLLKATMSGEQTPDNSAELVTVGHEQLTVTALFKLTDDNGETLFISYEPVFVASDSGRLKVASETMRVGRCANRIGAVVIERTFKGVKELGCRPEYLWRSIASASGDRTGFIVANRDAWSEDRSFLFSDDFLLNLPASLEHSARQLSEKAKKALSGDTGLVFKLLAELREFARNDMLVLTTRRNAAISYRLMPLVTETEDGGYDDRILNLLSEGVTTSDNFERLTSTIDTFNIIMPRLVPGLTLKLKELERVLLDNGEVGVRISPVSVRGDMEVPLRNESEGIVRIVSMLTYLIHVYNDQNACVVIDELDSGVFEYLLGEILDVFCQQAQGQLIFTAHNLRALEKMPLPDAVTLSTTVPGNRFIPFMSIGKTNNGRRRYLEAIVSGNARVPIYEFVPSQLVGAAFAIAGKPVESLV